MATEAPQPWVAPLDTTPSRRFSPAVASGERVPSGVADFDFLSGGIPIGSVVLLIGEAGAGQYVFALTSAVHMMLHHEDPKGHELFLGNAQGPFLVPSRVAYLSATRSRDQVLREVASAFEPSYHSVLEEHLDFHDLSPSYFVDSSVPSEWSSIPSPLLAETPVGPTGNALSAVADALEATGARHLVILDSLTDLLVRRGIDAESVL
ncbi:MAG: hypothetical protein L3J93_06225, partial [Thermoplasmata archaeon]|nr:hypothetical protein [Thermoplasmata archaeon]